MSSATTPVIIAVRMRDREELARPSVGVCVA